MPDWEILYSDRFIRAYKKYEKKNPDVLESLILNLDKYRDALIQLIHPIKIKGKFIHTEGKGLIALDQHRGNQPGKIEETRLYLYPDTETETLHLLLIGPKKSQERDVKSCHEYIKKKI